MLGRPLFLGPVAVLVLTTVGCSTKGATGASSTSASAAQRSSFTDSASAASATPPQANEGTGAIACTARDVVLKPGDSNADFNGMSHSGTYLTLTNKSRNACSIPGLPQLTFLDANGPVKADADLAGAKFMHPGPVVLPIVLQPKQSVTTSARWVSGSVFQDNLCYKLTGVTLALREGSAHTPLAGQMCGERSKGAHYDLQRYGTGPKP
ncbi:DUF4232 domain-containing protein [Terriglobus aquaticus]|uniref:DUF4232 domain-containing protein n=1 Tax=Terriglobus aquaticus TaxID=940139 RepID=A0ABW9KNN8_9BACT|nr:DUF4232 domain-containing protein [Terriglobus aquaticus]